MRFAEVFVSFGRGVQRSAGWLSAAAILTAAPGAAGQSSAEDRAAARALGTAGARLALEGKCSAAIEKLQRAAALLRAPTILTPLGECKVKLGRLVEGTELLQEVVRKRLGAEAPAAFIKAQERAQEVLKEALPKIGQLTVNVQAPEGTKFLVTIDGRPMSPALVGAPKPTDPGPRTVEAGADGFKTATATVTVPTGGGQTVTLKLEPDPAAAAAPAPPPPAPVAPAPAPPVPPPAIPPDTGPSEGGGSLVPAYVGFGVGAVGIGIGTVFGLSASSKKSDLEDNVCIDGRCPPSAQDDIDSMNSAATLSTIGFAVGLAGIGAGTYFLVTAGGSSEKATGPRPWVGLGSAGVRGAF